jgi:hypothetical protein
MPETSEPVQRNKVIDYLVCYALYAVLLVLCYFIFVTWTSLVLGLIGAFLGPTVANGTIYSFFLVLLGIALFVLVMAAEPYLRGGIHRQRVVQRFARIAVPLAAIEIVGEVINLLLRRIQ